MMTNKSVYLKEPSLEELRFTEMLLQDEDTMKFNEKWGGTVPFPKENWEPFYNAYVKSKDRLYFHIYNLDNQFVGEVSSRFDEYFNSHILNIKVLYRFRGNCHGYDALVAFLDHFFEDKNRKKISDNVALDNKKGIEVLERIGFKKVYVTSEYVMMELSRKNY